MQASGQRRTAVVVGVGAGLGLALVKAFAAQGYTVVAAARSISKLNELAAQWPRDGVVPVSCDATAPADVDSLFQRSEALGAVEIAVYNAGTFGRGSVLDTEAADFERCWRIGCFGGYLVGRAAARLMVARREGTILFTGATASLRGGAGFVNLASPKFALRALAQCMARELGPQGVHVAHVIIDGQIESERYAHLKDARGPDSLLAPSAIAEAYVALHRQPRSAWTQELDLRPWAEKF
jgi:NAD(P)-dependent dehydrogenase (short-subunit alcohol dehydrogenase family)